MGKKSTLHTPYEYTNFRVSILDIWKVKIGLPKDAKQVLTIRWFP